jgi:hypothetical protein
MAARSLTSTMPPERSTPVVDVLVLTMRDWAVHVHIEAILAKALQLRGAHVRFLTCGGGLGICDRVNTWEGPPMPCRSCTKYVNDALSAHGHQWSALRDHGSDEDGWPDLDTMSYEQLRAVTYRELPLGEIVQIPVTWFLLAEPIDRDPLGPMTFRAFLRSARAIVDRASAALDANPPDRVLMLNGTFLFEAIIWELCRRRGIPVVTYERGHIVDSFLFALEEPAGFANLEDVWPEWREVPLSAEESNMLDVYLDDRRFGRRASDVYWQRARFDVSDERPVGRRAVMFTNLVWDSAVVGQDVAFESIVDWIVCTIDVFERRPDDELIIRVHPAEEKLSGRESRVTMQAAVAERVPDLPPNVRFVSSGDPISSYALMDGADIGIVYSSTTGLELALAGTPVVVAAKTHYRGKGFTVDVSSPAEHVTALEAMLDDPARYQPDVEAARRYAHLFFFRVPYTDLGVREPIRGLVALTARRSGDLEPGASIDLDRFCEHFFATETFAPHPAHVDVQSSTHSPA